MLQEGARENAPKHQILCRYPELEAQPQPFLAVIAARTREAPQLFEASIQKGAKFVYLEKPGAESVEEMERMRALASAKGVRVYLGYNKNMGSYITKTLAAEKCAQAALSQGQRVRMALVHMNAFGDMPLEELFKWNPEGMLRNQCCHEVALAITFWGLTAENISSVSVNKEKTNLSSAGGLEDFTQLSFVVETTHGQSIFFEADRFGGDWSAAGVQVLDSAGGVISKEMFVFPDGVEREKMAQRMEADPELAWYFAQQKDLYVDNLRSAVRSSQGCADEQTSKLATIDTAVEVLRVAELLTSKLKDAVKDALLAPCSSTSAKRARTEA